MTRSVPGWRNWVGYAYLVLAWLFVACLAGQVVFAGLAVFDTPAYWHTHVTFVHFFEYLPIALLIIGVIARLPQWMLWLTGVEVLQLALQYALVDIGDIAGAFHPLNGMLLFGLAIILAYQPVRYVRKVAIRRLQTETSERPEHMQEIT